MKSLYSIIEGILDADDLGEVESVKDWNLIKLHLSQPACPEVESDGTIYRYDSVSPLKAWTAICSYGIGTKFKTTKTKINKELAAGKCVVGMWLDNKKQPVNIYIIAPHESEYIYISSFEQRVGPGDYKKFAYFKTRQQEPTLYNISTAKLYSLPGTYYDMIKNIMMSNLK